METLPTNYQQLCADYERIEKAIYYLEDNFHHQPGLQEVAASVGVSEYHFQRIFTRWAGISPKRFLQFLTKENAKDLLKRSSVMNVTYSVGLSSPGRLHDLFISTEAVTPGQYKMYGAGLVIRYGFHPTPFGKALLGVTERGICHLSFVQNSEEIALMSFKTNWNNATILEDTQSTGALITPIFSPDGSLTPLPLFVTGTNFQLKVWEALLNIPRGALTTYEQIAAQIDHPRALRAVGTAVGHNPIAYIIPCHRVIRKMGEFGNYRWGTARKKALLGWETAMTVITDQFPNLLSKSQGQNEK